MKEEALRSIRESKEIYLTPAQVAPVFGSNANWIRLAARQHPEWIPFPFILSGEQLRRVKIPRADFLDWYDHMTRR